MFSSKCKHNHIIENKSKKMFRKGISPNSYQHQDLQQEKGRLGNDGNRENACGVLILKSRL